MIPAVDDTHTEALRSWVDDANDPACDFPIQNLPLGVFRYGDGPRRIGIAIGTSIVDVAAAVDAGLLIGLSAEVDAAIRTDTLNALFALGRRGVSALRGCASRMLRADGEASRAASAVQRECLRAGSECSLELPATIGDYTDFYASVHHATNVGALFRPDNPLLPNYKWIPIGYHGRASSIIPSGTTVVRPHGQTRPDPAMAPAFGPSAMLDYELEIGAFTGAGNLMGQRLPLAHADEHLIGLCLVNDWSARDIQSWEYQPLGPFLAKNFATTISPWVVTLEALAPFRRAPAERSSEDPPLLGYLDDPMDRANGAFAITLEVFLRTPRMRMAGESAVRVSRGSFSDMYWTLGQMLAHHASNGCNIRPGDLIASGTVSGTAPDSRGCLLEITSRGKQALALPNGESRRFLEDGDEVILRASCERTGFRRIGFGECAGMIAAANEWTEGWAQ